jgi:hypothetical protein
MSTTAKRRTAPKNAREIQSLRVYGTGKVGSRDNVAVVRDARTGALFLEVNPASSGTSTPARKGKSVVIKSGPIAGENPRVVTTSRLQELKTRYAKQLLSELVSRMKID